MIIYDHSSIFETQKQMDKLQANYDLALENIAVLQELIASQKEESYLLRKQAVQISSTAIHFAKTILEQVKLPLASTLAIAGAINTLVQVRTLYEKQLSEATANESTTGSTPE